MKLSGDTSDFDRDMNRARREMERTEQQGESFTSSVRALEGAFVAAGAAAAGLSAGLGLMAYRYSKVDQSLAQIQGSTQATTAQMDSMRQTAMQLGEDLPISFVEATNALQALTNSGLSAAQATEAVAGTANLAALSELEMAEAAQLTTGILNGFGLEAERAGAAADIIAVAARSSTTDIQGMAEAIRGASTAANQLGVSAVEVSAFVETLTAAGVEASQAGSSIETALTALVNPSQEARTALASAGLAMEDFYTKSGDLKSMNNVLTLLKENLAGMSEARQQAILTDVFGDRGAQAISRGIDHVDEFRNSIEDLAQAQVAGGISRLGDLSDQELSQRQQEVGFDLQPGSTRDVLEQYRQLAQNQGLSQEQLSTQIEVGLNISPRAADVLAGDLTGGTDMGQLVSGIENASSASERAAESMDTFRGRVVQLGGSLDTFFYNVYQGAKGPLSLMLAVLNPIADMLAQSDTVAYALGVAMVGLAGAATAAAIALGVMYAEIVLLERGLWSAMTMTATYEFITSTLTLTQLSAAASSFTLSGALTVVTTALSGAASAALSFWAAIGPIGWVILGLIGLFAAWKTGLLDFIGLGGEADAVVESLMWALGGLADVLGIAGGELGGVVGWLLEYLGVALKISTLGLVIFIKSLGVALRVLGDIVRGTVDPMEGFMSAVDGAAGAVGGFITTTQSLASDVGGFVAPFESLISIMNGTADAADWLNVALLAIPGVGVIAWALNAAGVLGDLSDPIDTVTNGIDWLIDKIDDLNGGSLDPIIGALELLASTVQWVGEMAQWALDKLNKVPGVGALVPDSGGEAPSQPSKGGGESGMTTQNDQAAAATGDMSRRQRESAVGGGGGGGGNPSIQHSPTYQFDLNLDNLAAEVHDAADTAINDLRSDIETQLFRFQNGQ